MLRGDGYDWPVIEAAQLREARIRAGFTSQAALAEALNISERTVTSWEKEGGHVSTRAEARVRALLWPAPGPLASYSSYELLSELGRRLDLAARMVEREQGNVGVSDFAYGVNEPATRGNNSGRNPHTPAQARPAKGPSI